MLLQVVEDVRDVRMMLDGRPVESALTEGLSHPGVCKLLAHKTMPSELQRRNSVDGAAVGLGGDGAAQLQVGISRRCRSYGGPGAKAAAESELWLILEFCDKGSMQVRACLQQDDVS